MYDIKKCAHGHAWYGRCVKVRACRCLHELLALRRSAASTRPAIESSTAVFQRLPCLQTRYIVERAPDASITLPST